MLNGVHMWAYQYRKLEREGHSFQFVGVHKLINLVACIITDVTTTK